MSAATESVVDQLLFKFPDFHSKWIEARGSEDEERLPYVEVGEFARFVMQDIFERRDEAGIQRVFDEVDRIFASGDDEVQTLITIGFLENIQNLAGKDGLETLTQFLSPRLVFEWDALNKFWSGEIKFIPSR